MRLLLLHEVAVSYAGLRFADALNQAQAQLKWLFEGAQLRLLSPQEARGLPKRGRVEQPWGYGAYFAGPPEPLYLLLEYPGVQDPLELRLTALYLEYLLAALQNAGYREELERQARSDWLTGLGNRWSLERRLHQGLALGWGVALLDVDGLKALNDSQGHLAGDRLLSDIGAALRQSGFEAYRIGGDEFVVLLERGQLPKLRQIAARFSASLGVAWAEQGQPQQLLQLADARMYRHKRRRKGSSDQG